LSKDTDVKQQVEIPVVAVGVVTGNIGELAVTQKRIDIHPAQDVELLNRETGIRVVAVFVEMDAAKRLAPKYLKGSGPGRRPVRKVHSLELERL